MSCLFQDLGLPNEATAAVFDEALTHLFVAVDMVIVCFKLQSGSPVELFSYSVTNDVQEAMKSCTVSLLQRFRRFFHGADVPVITTTVVSADCQYLCVCVDPGGSADVRVILIYQLIGSSSKVSPGHARESMILIHTQRISKDDRFSDSFLHMACGCMGDRLGSSSLSNSSPETVMPDNSSLKKITESFCFGFFIQHDNSLQAKYFFTNYTPSLYESRSVHDFPPIMNHGSKIVVSKPLIADILFSKRIVEFAVSHFYANSAVTFTTDRSKTLIALIEEDALSILRYIPSGSSRLLEAPMEATHKATSIKLRLFQHSVSSSNCYRCLKAFDLSLSCEQHNIQSPLAEFMATRGLCIFSLLEYTDTHDAKPAINLLLLSVTSFGESCTCYCSRATIPLMASQEEFSSYNVFSHTIDDSGSVAVMLLCIGCLRSNNFYVFKVPLSMRMLMSVHASSDCLQHPLRTTMLQGSLLRCVPSRAFDATSSLFSSAALSKILKSQHLHAALLTISSYDRPSMLAPLVKAFPDLVTDLGPINMGLLWATEPTKTKDSSSSIELPTEPLMDHSICSSFATVELGIVTAAGLGVSVFYDTSVDGCVHTTDSDSLCLITTRIINQLYSRGYIQQSADRLPGLPAASERLVTEYLYGSSGTTSGRATTFYCPVVLFALFRSTEHARLLSKLITLQTEIDGKLDRSTARSGFILSNIRPIYAMCRQTILLSTITYQYLVKYFKDNKDSSQTRLMQAESMKKILDGFLCILDSALLILQTLIRVRQTFEIGKKQALALLHFGRGVNVCLILFGFLCSHFEMGSTDFTAQVSRLQRSSSLASSRVPASFVDIPCIYTKEFGYYVVSESLTMDDISESSGHAKDILTTKLSQLRDTAVTDLVHCTPQRKTLLEILSTVIPDTVLRVSIKDHIRVESDSARQVLFEEGSIIEEIDIHNEAHDIDENTVSNLMAHEATLESLKSCSILAVYAMLAGGERGVSCLRAAAALTGAWAGDDGPPGFRERAVYLAARVLFAVDCCYAGPADRDAPDVGALPADELAPLLALPGEGDFLAVQLLDGDALAPADRRLRRALLGAALRALPCAVADPAQPRLSARHWASRLCLLALARGMLPLARALAPHGLDGGEAPGAPVLWPAHPGAGRAELAVRTGVLAAALQGRRGAVSAARAAAVLRAQLARRTPGPAGRRLALLLGELSVGNLSSFPIDLIMGSSARCTSSISALFAQMICASPFTSMEVQLLTAYCLSRPHCWGFLLIFLANASLRSALLFHEASEQSGAAACSHPMFNKALKDFKLLRQNAPRSIVNALVHSKDTTGEKFSLDPQNHLPPEFCNSEQINTVPEVSTLTETSILSASGIFHPDKSTRIGLLRTLREKFSLDQFIPDVQFSAPKLLVAVSMSVLDSYGPEVLAPQANVERSLARSAVGMTGSIFILKRSTVPLRTSQSRVDVPSSFLSAIDNIEEMLNAPTMRSTLRASSLGVASSKPPESPQNQGTSDKALAVVRARSKTAPALKTGARTTALNMRGKSNKGRVPLTTAERARTFQIENKHKRSLHLPKYLQLINRNAAADNRAQDAVASRPGYQKSKKRISFGVSVVITDTY